MSSELYSSPASDRADAPSVSPSPTISLVLADPHPLVLQGMQYLFRGEPDLDVRACCTDADEALAALLEHDPAVLVVDRQLPPRGAMALLRDLAPHGCATRVVLLTDSINKRELEESLRLGVRAAVLTRTTARLLVQCVRGVHRGDTWLEHAPAVDAVEAMVRHGAGLMQMKQRLTSRELQVLTLVAAGLRNKDITTKLAIAEGTVKIHLHNIYEKLGINDRLTLALCARDAGLV